MAAYYKSKGSDLAWRALSSPSLDFSLLKDSSAHKGHKGSNPAGIRRCGSGDYEAWIALTLGGACTANLCFLACCVLCRAYSYIPRDALPPPTPLLYYKRHIVWPLAESFLLLATDHSGCLTCFAHSESVKQAKRRERYSYTLYAMYVAIRTYIYVLLCGFWTMISCA